METIPSQSVLLPPNREAQYDSYLSIYSTLYDEAPNLDVAEKPPTFESKFSNITTTCPVPEVASSMQPMTNSSYIEDLSPPARKSIPFTEDIVDNCIGPFSVRRNWGERFEKSSNPPTNNTSKDVPQRRSTCGEGPRSGLPDKPSIPQSNRCSLATSAPIYDIRSANSPTFLLTAEQNAQIFPADTQSGNSNEHTNDSYEEQSFIEAYLDA